MLEPTAAFDMSQPAVSKHLRVLEQAGLISRRRDAQRRPCRLAPARLHQLAVWVGSYRQFWEDSVDRMDSYVDQLTDPATAPPDHVPTEPTTTGRTPS